MPDEEMIDMRQSLLTVILAALVLAGVAGTAGAEVVRYHYLPTTTCGYSSTSLKVGPGGATRKYKTFLLSPASQPYYCQLKATHMVTFFHPFTNQNVTVPMALPLGTPRVEILSDTIVYTFTQYTIRVQFLHDGSVDV